ncbi:hypothetical protein DJ93_1336 [Bacillus clarus]|uniref:Uncharacterized protein n=1 Tax=Bacillus clarus TaxID=2338372 RepID=A0A090YWQ6_9BACI|nr:hypothetical protein DJ93_1336 [Bacillus clarus]
MLFSLVEKLRHEVVIFHAIRLTVMVVRQSVVKKGVYEK